MEDIRYYIFDPTGNITALVETEVPVDRQPEIAAQIMQKHPEVEQVGYVCYEDASVSDVSEAVKDNSDRQGSSAVTCKDCSAQVSMRMAGGEFCGNATMCAAAWYALKTPEHPDPSGVSYFNERIIKVKASGVKEPLEVVSDRQ
jgi:diaminopimelate epimerase